MYHKILSIGHRCTSQIAINSLENYGETTPFSWVNNFNALNVLNTLKSNFSNYLNNQEKRKNYHRLDDLPFNTRHGFGHYKMNQTTIQSFERKINRFLNYLNSESKILFVYINEDYIYSEDYRATYEKNYEDLKKINDYLMTTYPNLDFTIFNVVFKEKEDYKNIKNVVYDRKINYIERKVWLKNGSFRSNLEHQFRNNCKRLLKDFITGCINENI